MDKVTATLCGVYVVETGLVDTVFDGFAFGLAAGTGLAFIAKSEASMVVRLKQEGCALTSFKDDKGRDLLKNAAGQAVAVRWEYADNSIDRKTFGVQVSTRSSPKQGASALTAKGKITLVLADGEDPRELKGVALRPGPLALEGFDISILKVGPPEFTSGTGNALGVRIERRGAAVDAVKSIEFFDADGTPLSSAGMYLPQTDPDRLEGEYTLTKAVDTADVRVGLWRNARPFEVTLRATVRLGIPPVRV